MEHIGDLHVMFETVSDMTMFGLFYLQNRSRIIDLSDFNAVQAGIFEENHYMGFHQEFRGRFPLGRKIIWKKKQPHYITNDKSLVPVLGFHFQGHAKREMLKIFAGVKRKIPAKEYWLHQKKYYRFILATYKRTIMKLLP